MVACCRAIENDGTSVAVQVQGAEPTEFMKGCAEYIHSQYGEGNARQGRLTVIRVRKPIARAQLLSIKALSLLHHAKMISLIYIGECQPIKDSTAVSS